MDPLPIVLTLFPIVFAGLWLLISSLLMRMSGWYALEERFPDDEREELLLSLPMQSAIFGGSAFGGVNFNGCLTLQVCTGGLRFKVWKIFGPFAKPFLVPWRHIATSHARVFLFSYVRLGLGSPEEKGVKIRPRTARRIEQASRGQFRLQVD
ncbi:hypothetical protein [Parerythrobacter aestuarii]|uniref:hypothetical protein n=1 Tax=Parerythrobacter aestuarii TaxID=3020909 RepID=UPI0024DE4A8F|nr:hypothetical protein [Parerythrobacter aestuarii]